MTAPCACGERWRAGDGDREAWGQRHAGHDDVSTMLGYLIERAEEIDADYRRRQENRT